MMAMSRSPPRKKFTGYFFSFFFSTQSIDVLCFTLKTIFSERMKFFFWRSSFNVDQFVHLVSFFFLHCPSQSETLRKILLSNRILKKIIPGSKSICQFAVSTKGRHFDKSGAKYCCQKLKNKLNPGVSVHQSIQWVRSLQARGATLIKAVLLPSQLSRL